MIDRITAYLDSFGSWLYGWFVAPGSFLLSKFAAVAPATAFDLGIEPGQTEGTTVIALSLASWLLLCIVCALAWGVLRNGVRLTIAMVLTAWHRLAVAATGFKTNVVLKLRSLVPARSAHRDATSPAVEFDDLDLAVLHSVSEQGPGYTLSAPELAEAMSLLPAQIQRSLDKLSRNNMLRSTIGSTDGFDNYCLSETGAAFVSMYQRQATRG